MFDKPSPYIYALLMTQQSLLTAMIAARFNPAEFEANIAAVRGTLKMAVLTDPEYSPDQKNEADKTVDDLLALYLRIFRAGDPNA
jgi:hypothetical protein